jgi:hypothetical protein
MLVRLLAVTGLVLGLSGCSSAPEQPASSAANSKSDAPVAAAPQEAPKQAEEEQDTGRGLGWRLLWYIPNRISDALDIVRLRIRFGPGIAIDARATELVDLYAGTYATFFVGLPGPRGERSFNWPFGFESKSGLEVSVADATVEGGIGPHYGVTEFGFGTQILLIGFDVGIEPLAIVDFAVGLLTFDISDDDI